MDLYKELATAPFHKGIEVVLLPWDKFQEVNIVDPERCQCDDPVDIARVVDSPAIVGYFSHHDRDNQRRWYGHANWRLIEETAIHIHTIEHVENVIAQEGTLS